MGLTRINTNGREFFSTTEEDLHASCCGAFSCRPWSAEHRSAGRADCPLPAMRAARSGPRVPRAGLVAVVARRPLRRPAQRRGGGFRSASPTCPQQAHFQVSAFQRFSLSAFQRFAQAAVGVGRKGKGQVMMNDECHVSGTGHFAFTKFLGLTLPRLVPEWL